MSKKRNIALVLRFLTLVWLACAAVFRAVAQTETWYLDPPHSAAQFSVRHMGISTVHGTFSKVGGVVIDSPDLSKASVNVTIDASSVDSRVEMRDKDLRVTTTSMSPSIRRLPSYQSGSRLQVRVG